MLARGASAYGASAIDRPRNAVGADGPRDSGKKNRVSRESVVLKGQRGTRRGVEPT